MVGTQRPKSRPGMVDFCTPPEGAEEGPEPAGVAEEETITVCMVLAQPIGVGVGVGVTVTVRMHDVEGEDAELWLVCYFMQGVISDLPAVDVEEVTTVTGTAPRGGALPTLPARSFVVKFEKPALTITCATLNPAALNCVCSEAAEFWFSTVDPTTAGSIRGTMPRRREFAGRVGSLQIEGMLTRKGLKFCSAATKPRAAATASAPVPSWARISSDF
jgi:hypothetical protein